MRQITPQEAAAAIRPDIARLGAIIDEIFDGKCFDPEIARQRHAEICGIEARVLLTEIACGGSR